MITVIHILVPAIFTFILKEFFDLFLLNKYSAKLTQYSIWFIYFVLDFLVGSKVRIDGVANIIYTFCLLTVFCFIIYKNDLKYILLIELFIIFIGVISEMIIAFGIRLFLNPIEIESFSLFGSTCSKIVILIIIRVIKLFKISELNHHRISFIDWVVNITITVGNLYIIYNLYILSLKEVKLLGPITAALVTLMLNIIYFKMFDKIVAEAEVKRKNDIYEQSIEIYKKEIEEREKNNERFRMFRHDIKNHLISVEKLVQMEEYDRLKTYLAQITNSYNILSTHNISGNLLIDGLLDNKFERAKKYNILIDYDIKIPDKLPFEDVDLCIIISNVLDNAIDANIKVIGEKKISLCIKFNKGNLMVKIENTYNPESVIYDKSPKKLKTNKVDKINHGFGISLIEETVQKYCGTFNINIKDNLFFVKILLYHI